MENSFTGPREHTRSLRSWWPFSSKYNWVLFPLTWSGERWASGNTPLLLCNKSESAPLWALFSFFVNRGRNLVVLRISVDCAVVTSSEKMSPKGGAQESLLPPSFILTPLHMRCGLCVSVCVCVLNAVQLFETPWTVASLSLGFPRQQYWSRLLFPPPGVLPNPGKNLCLLHWQADSLPLRYLGSTGFLACGYNAACFAWKAQGRDTLLSLLHCLLTQEPQMKLWESSPEFQLHLGNSLVQGPSKIRKKLHWYQPKSTAESYFLIISSIFHDMHLLSRDWQGSQIRTPTFFNLEQVTWLLWTSAFICKRKMTRELAS